MPKVAAWRARARELSIFDLPADGHDAGERDLRVGGTR